MYAATDPTAHGPAPDDAAAHTARRARHRRRPGGPRRRLPPGQARGMRFLLVDAAPEIGHCWATRWDSLRLFTPAEYSALPGMAFPAAPGTYPGKDQVAGYLKAYAARFDLPVMPNTRVRHVDEPRRSQEGPVPGRHQPGHPVGPAGHRGHRTVPAARHPRRRQRVRARGEPAAQLDLPKPQRPPERGLGECPGGRSGELRAPDRARARPHP